MIDTDTEHTIVHGPCAQLPELREALERAGWTIANVTNGGPYARVTIEGDDLVEHFTAGFGYICAPLLAWPE